MRVARYPTHKGACSMFAIANNARRGLNDEVDTCSLLAERHPNTFPTQARVRIHLE